MAGRSIAIPGTGNRNQRGAGSNYALTIFGRSTRESNCDCDRSMEASLLQTVYLQNDQELLGRIDNGGWLNQITRPGGANRPTAAPQRGAEGARRIAKLREEIEEARKAGDKKRLAGLQARLTEATRGSAPSDKPAVQETKRAIDAKSMDAAAVVKQAYLRTLSRYPSDQELARCRREIEQASDTTSGLRNVLWALLNTKEFIVNH